MLFKILGALLDMEEKVNSGGITSQRKMTPKEKSKHEYNLWVMSEEFEDLDD